MGLRADFRSSLSTALTTVMRPTKPFTLSSSQLSACQSHLRSEVMGCGSRVWREADIWQIRSDPPGPYSLSRRSEQNLRSGSSYSALGWTSHHRRILRLLHLPRSRRRCTSCFSQTPCGVEPLWTTLISGYRHCSYRLELPSTSLPPT